MRKPFAAGLDRVAISRVDVARGGGDPEELGADALVDVAVDVDLDQVERLRTRRRSDVELGRWEFGVSVFMAVPLARVPRMSAFGTGWIRFRTIMRNIRRSRS